MKWLLVLFATYMLLLPCIPCNAAEACCMEEKATSDCASGETPCGDEHDTSGEAPCHHEHGRASGEVPCEDEHDTSGEAPCHHEHGRASGEVPCEDEHDTSGEAPCHDEHGSASGQVPCEDEHDGAPEEQTHHEHSPICPCCPSFSCNTCHSLVISAHFVLEEPGIPVLNFDNASFADDPLANFSALIWQPPRGL